MNRRQLILGLGSAGVGSAALVGSGAFTSVGVDRSVSLSVTGDADGYLGLDANFDDFPNSEYATELDNGVVAIDATGNADGNFNGTGVSPSASTIVEEVVAVTNQGTQDVLVFGTSTELEVADERFELFLTDLDDKATDRVNLLTPPDDVPSGGVQIVGPGETVGLGFEVDGRGLSESELGTLGDLLTDLQVTIRIDVEEVPNQ